MSTDVWSGPWSACLISGPTHVHRLTAAMLESVSIADMVGDMSEVLLDSTLVASNVAFAYAFLAAEAEILGAELFVDSAMYYGLAVRPGDLIFRDSRRSRRTTGVSPRSGRMMPSAMLWF